MLLSNLIDDQRLTSECKASHPSPHQVKLIALIPDLLLADLDVVFHLDSDEVIYNKEKKNLLGYGTFAKIYCGQYKEQP